jgi:hypothetical protein
LRESGDTTEPPTTGAIQRFGIMRDFKDDLGDSYSVVRAARFHWHGKWQHTNSSAQVLSNEFFSCTLVFGGVVE